MTILDWIAALYLVSAFAAWAALETSQYGEG